MAERVRVREREAIQGNPGSSQAYRDHVKGHLERGLRRQVVITPDDRPWDMSRMGRCKWFLHTDVDDGTALGRWWVFRHEAWMHSGSHRHQGGLIIYIVEGSGYSVVEGVKRDWQAGDLLCLPLTPGGVEHQHFSNTPGEPYAIVAFIYTPVWDSLATNDVQVKDSPDYLAQ